MILEHLTVRNFCLFRDQQVLDLTPAPAPRNAGTRRIVLFGGTNGAGKTTLLDAIQLALYGPRARCSKRVNLSYDEFLRQSIHHGVCGEEGASVSLSFRYATGGEEHLLEVCRSWTVQGGKVREDVRVLQDALPDRWHTEHWNQLVEEFFPLEVSQLFFFDAEKIRSLAEDETSSQVLGTAVKSLLGLDIVERLIADAAGLEAELAKGVEPARGRDDRAELERAIEALNDRLATLRAQRAEIQSLQDRIKNEIQLEEAEFTAAGGRQWEARDDREKRQEELGKRIGDREAGLVALAASELPLCLVGELLSSVARQDERERETAEVTIIQHLLSERDDRLLAVLAEAKAAPGMVRKIKDFLASDRQSRAAAARDVTPRLELGANARSLLHHLLRQRLAELRHDAEDQLVAHAQLRQEQAGIERALSITPEEEGIGQFLKRLREKDERLATLNAEKKRLDIVFEEATADLKGREAKLQAMKEREAKEEFAQDDRMRMSRIAGKTRDVRRDFLARATERKIDRLSELITDSFRFLLRKQTMVERIHIDPLTFGITLFNEAGQALPKQRLSEGEKQLFAISVLWGLARASAHPLPAIIDTPMARLDAAHRRHLVERYFPHASHQVIILSTDTEVDRHYYNALQPHIARAYHLCYEEETRATRAEEGYFWREASEDSQLWSRA
jgi:DNA sulfur modification protein DndD